MEGILEKLGWKKVAALLIAVSLFGLIFVFLSLTEADKAALLNKKSAQNPSNNSGNTNFEITKAPQQGAAKNANKTYITPFYQISYPETYELTVFGIQAGILDGSLLANSKNGVKIDISVFDSSTNSVDQLSQIPKDLGYFESEVRVGDITGKSFDGTMKGTRLYERIVLLEKNRNIIKVQLMAENGTTKQINDEFSSILQTFQ